jgi:chemotaxis protein methyltransferase WspC
MDAITDDRWAEVEALLRRRIGLNPEAVGRKHVHGAVRQHLAVCDFPDTETYLARLHADDAVFQQLVERLVVSESWFFRDVKPFAFLELCIGERRKTLAAQRPLRLLSVPCGGGEEPYSMAMTLLNMGVSDFHLDAVDISAQAVQQAERGVYRESSFREKTEVVAGFRERYFRRDGPDYVVADEVRRPVRFRRANVVELGFLAGEAAYDVIFCRNLLIYLDTDGRRSVLAHLRRLLDRDGVLYVGHVEAGSLRSEPFAPHSPAYPFAFRHRRDDEPQRSTSVPATVKRGPTKPRPLPKRQFATSPTVAKASVPVVDAPTPFDTARRLADEGRLDEAAVLCRELLAKQPLDAALHGLLGVVRQAQGDAAEAEKCFQKALYLDPRQHEALIHLALLAKQRGDDVAERNYRRRADKIQGEA